MFRHKQAANNEVSKNPETQPADLKQVNSVPPETAKPEASLKELMEKNLKWSQIIYEQNRKINSKLLWSAIANWLRLLLIVVPLVLAIIFLPSLFRDFMSQYSDLLGSDKGSDTQQSSFGNLILKWSNLDPAQQEQIKAMFNK